MTLKVLIRPQYDGVDSGDGGIRRVVEAQFKHLPDYDIEPLRENDKLAADVCAVHAAESPVEDQSIPVVAHNHGLYWSHEQEWPDWAWHVNKKCIENMREAKIITAPSQWVSDSIARGMMRKARVIPHGINLEEWEPSAERENYILWNKARVDVVSDPRVLIELSRELPSNQFLTTFGDMQQNVTVIGNRVPYHEMRNIVRRAGVMLATVRETFGIGTLEAMACGVPVVGWNFGGQVDVIEHGVDGWLSPVGDVNHLAEGVRWALVNRKKVGDAARDKIERLYQWKDVIKLYADIYREAAQIHTGPKVSVIVTCYNLAQYLPDTLYSILGQTFKDYECVIVDDGSKDNSFEIASDFAKQHDKFRAIKHDRNQGLVAARNTGVKESRGEFIIFLDADDMFPPNALEILTYHMSQRRDLSVASGHLDIVRHDGTERRRNPWPFPEYDHSRQLKHLNNIPYCSLIRKNHWLDAGGYRLRADRNEDAEMWCRLGSYGWKIEKVTQEPVLIYRDRGDSKSKQEGKDGGEPDWSFWNTWRDNPRLMPYGSIAKPPKQLISWPVRSFANPQVSVVIPVGPGHGVYLPDVLDTLLAQTFPYWEAIVVNDSGEKLDLRGFPFVREYVTRKKGSGAGVARNTGVKHARAELLFFVDADDMLFPDCLRKHVEAWNESMKRGKPAIIYSDWISVKANKVFEETKAFDWDCKAVMMGAKNQATMLITFLHSKAMYESVGGFDETIHWEDWDYHIKLATKAAVCGWHITEPLMFYRMTTGGRREYAFDNRDELLKIICNRYKDYYEGKKMCGCGASGAKVKVNNVNGNLGPNQPLESDGYVLVDYINAPLAKHLVVGKATGELYGRRESGSRFYVKPQDVELGSTKGGEFARVPDPVLQPSVLVEVSENADLQLA